MLEQNSNHAQKNNINHNYINFNMYLEIVSHW